MSSLQLDDSAYAPHSRCLKSMMSSWIEESNFCLYDAILQGYFKVKEFAHIKSSHSLSLSQLKEAMSSKSVIPLSSSGTLAAVKVEFLFFSSRFAPRPALVRSRRQ